MNDYKNMYNNKNEKKMKSWKRLGYGENTNTHCVNCRGK